VAVVKWANDEKAAAKLAGSVVIAWAVNGTGAPGFPEKDLSQTVSLPPAQAEELLDTIRGKLKSFKAAAANAGA